MDGLSFESVHQNKGIITPGSKEESKMWFKCQQCALSLPSENAVISNNILAWGFSSFPCPDNDLLNQHQKFVLNSSNLITPDPKLILVSGYGCAWTMLKKSQWKFDHASKHEFYKSADFAWNIFSCKNLQKQSDKINVKYASNSIPHLRTLFTHVQVQW